MPLREFFRRRNSNPSSTTLPANAAASSSRGHTFLRFHRANMRHRDAIVPPSQDHLTAIARRRQPNRWLLEVSHLIQMLEMTVLRLSAPPPNPPGTSTSTFRAHRRLSVASVTNVLNHLSAHHSSQPAEPERSIVTETNADIEAIMSYRVDEIELSRAPYFLERLLTTRHQLAELAPCELLEAVDRVVARMREWVRAEEVAGRGAGAVIFGGK